MKTYTPTPDQIDRKWHLVNADDLILGRLASRLAILLQGKHKPMYAPHLDCGDHIVIVNAEKVRLTGRKREQKKYYHHTGYQAGLRETSFDRMLEKHPEEILRRAVRRMLPKSKLGRQMLTKLHIHVGPDHPHQAQKPEPLDPMKRS